MAGEPTLSDLEDRGFVYPNDVAHLLTGDDAVVVEERDRCMALLTHAMLQFLGGDGGHGCSVDLDPASDKPVIRAFGQLQARADGGTPYIDAEALMRSKCERLGLPVQLRKIADEDGDGPKRKTLSFTRFALEWNGEVGA